MSPVIRTIIFQFALADMDPTPDDNVTTRLIVNQAITTNIMHIVDELRKKIICVVDPEYNFIIDECVGVHLVHDIGSNNVDFTMPLRTNGTSVDIERMSNLLNAPLIAENSRPIFWDFECSGGFMITLQPLEVA